MFGSSLASGGKFATSVIGAVAKGDISSVGSITGEQASEALTSYLGYSSAAASEIQTDDPVTIPTAKMLSPSMEDQQPVLSHPKLNRGRRPVPPTRWFPLRWEQNQFLKEAH